MTNEDSKPSLASNNLGGCLGAIVGVCLGLLFAFFWFPWLQLEGKPKGLASFVLLPPFIPIFICWPLGAYLWKLLFPSLNTKTNEQLVTCSVLALFFAAFVIGLLYLLFGAELLNSIQDR